MRDDHQRAVVVLQRLGERLAHLDVEVVGRLVEQQQVRLLPDDQRKREPRLLAAGEVADRRGRHVAVEVEAAQEVAQLLLARVRLELPQVPQRRVLLAQLLDLVLREVAERAIPARRGAVRSPAPACRRCAFSSVDLPAPLGPSRPMRSPARMPQFTYGSTGGRSG